MVNLDPVIATVTVAGTSCHFTKLTLNQAFNAHHSFCIDIDYEEFGGKWMESPTKMVNLIGKDVTIVFNHKESGHDNLFSGIIAQVSHSGYHGQQNSIIISGYSPTIKLAGKPTMNSFIDLPLQQIVNEAVGDSGNGGAVIANPVFGSKLDYVCQYDESCFDFLNRLSWEFGEWFYYSGIDVFFGMKQGNGATIEYDKEMTYFDLSANLVPGKFNRHHYLHHDDKEIDKDEPESVPGERGYLIVSKKRSESIYTSVANSPLNPAVNTKKDLDDLVKAERGRNVGEMLIMRGKTKTCKVKIGGTVTIELPDTMDVTAKSVDTFLVTKVFHEIDQEGRYNNSFEGIMAGIEVIPMEEPKIPIANPQIATVKSNADEKKLGRVKIQTQWQKAKNKTTNWIRVQTPDAGKSDLVPKNRGFVFIPEKGDLVMIGFEYGNPSRPFVMGSIFSEKISKGGGIDNNIKTIITRQKHMIELDDTEGKEKITIIDKNQNQILINTSEDDITITANNNITINAGETMTLNAKNLKINVKESIDTYAGENKKLFVGKNSEALIQEDYQFESKNKKEFIHNDVVIKIGKLFRKICGTYTVNTTEGDLRMQASGKALMQGKEDARVSKG